MKAIIYKISNDINGKIYIGQTWKTKEQRFQRHCAEARWGKTKNMPIVLAIKKYGASNFSICSLEEMEGCTQQEVDDREVYWVLKLNSFSPSGYNLKAGGARGIASDEVKRKISMANKGRKASKETIERLRISHLGKRVSNDTKKKLSEANKGKTLSMEHKLKIAKSITGSKKTEEAREKMRTKKLKYNYKIRDPNGVVWETNNLWKFSHEMGLNAGHMASVASGRIPHYRYWRITRTPILL